MALIRSRRLFSYVALIVLASGHALASVDESPEDEVAPASAWEIGDALYVPPVLASAERGAEDTAAATSREMRAGDALVPSRFLSHILAAARETDVEPALIHAVIAVESGFNPAARSRYGALGLMQLMPGTARRYGVTNRLDPAQNIRGGARYLRDLMAMFDNDLQLVLAAYNAGEEAVIRYGRRIPPFRATVAFVPRVMGHYWKFRGDRPEAR